MGSCPDWYEYIRAGRYLRVAPWSLLDAPDIWIRWALGAESAENEADRQRSHAKTASQQAFQNYYGEGGGSFS